MRARQPSGSHEEPPPESYDEASSPEDERPVRLEVCLSCGAAPGLPGECAHDEVAVLPQAPVALQAAVERLRAVRLQCRQLERTLRKLAAVEVAAGRGELRVSPAPVALPVPAPAPVVPAVMPSVPPGTACPQCGQVPPATAKPARRRRPDPGQASFGFVQDEAGGSGAR